MALFNAFTPTKSADVVAVINADTGLQVFPGARPIKATVSESAKLMAHPLEDGSNIVDHRIILPIGISLAVILDAETYRDTYQEIRRLFRESVRMTIQTKTHTYQNLYMQDIPHEEDTALFDTVTMILQFIETLVATVQILALPPAAVRDPADTSTSDRGEQTTTDAGNRGSFIFRRTIG